MNELLFFCHVALVIGFVMGALRLGKQALVALIALQAVLANLFVVKQMSFFGFSVTCSDVFMVGSILSLNLLQEYFGKEAAQRATAVSFLSLVFFFAMAQVHLLYEPIPTDGTHEAFVTIFSSSIRIVAASIGVYWVVQKLDVMLYGWLSRFFEGRKLAVRLGLSLLATQFLDTALFSFFGLYGLVVSIVDVMIVSYAVKCVVIAISSAFVALSKRFVKDAIPI